MPFFNVAPPPEDLFLMAAKPLKKNLVFFKVFFCPPHIVPFHIVPPPGFFWTKWRGAIWRGGGHVHCRTISAFPPRSLHNFRIRFISIDPPRKRRQCQFIRLSRRIFFPIIQNYHQLNFFISKMLVCLDICKSMMSVSALKKSPIVIFIFIELDLGFSRRTPALNNNANWHQPSPSRGCGPCLHTILY